MCVCVWCVYMFANVFCIYCCPILSFDLLGAGRVTFSSKVVFMSAVSCRSMQVTYGDIDKKVGLATAQWLAFCMLYVSHQ